MLWYIAVVSLGLEKVGGVSFGRAALWLYGVGAVLVAAAVLPGWGRWVPLVLGAYVFVPLFPAVFGPMVLGRIAIGVWLLLFAALGVALVRAAQEEARP